MIAFYSPCRSKGSRFPISSSSSFQISHCLSWLAWLFSLNQVRAARASFSRVEDIEHLVRVDDAELPDVWEPGDQTREHRPVVGMVVQDLGLEGLYDLKLEWFYLLRVLETWTICQQKRKNRGEFVSFLQLPISLFCMRVNNFHKSPAKYCYCCF